MITPDTLREYKKAQPFRPFRIHTPGGRTYEVRHPEMITILKSSVQVFKANSEPFDIPDTWENVSLMLTEAVSHIDAPVL